MNDTDNAELEKLRGFYAEIVREIGHDNVLAAYRQLRADHERIMAEVRTAVHELERSAEPFDSACTRLRAVARVVAPTHLAE